MASQFEDLLEHLVLGNKLRIPIDSINLGSFRTAYHRYAKDNVLIGNRKLNIEVELAENIYILGLVCKEAKKQIAYEVIPNEGK